LLQEKIEDGRPLAASIVLHFDLTAALLHQEHGASALQDDSSSCLHASSSPIILRLSQAKMEAGRALAFATELHLGLTAPLVHHEHKESLWH